MTGTPKKHKQFRIADCHFKNNYHVYKKNTENPDADLTIVGEIVERNGKNHLVIRNVSSHIEVTHLHLKTKCKNLWGFVNRRMNKMCNAKWKLLKADLDHLRPSNQFWNRCLKRFPCKICSRIKFQNKKSV